MTPRALIATIGATAVAFAVAIGGAAAGVPGLTTADGTSVTSATTDARVLAYDWPQSGSEVGVPAALWNDPCVVAV